VYHTESELGIAIAESSVARSSLFITTKVMKGIDNIAQSFEKSLKNLRLDYVDLYLIHAPFFAKSEAELQAAWTELEVIKASGRAKSIGVSNFLPEHLLVILKTAKIRPSINQVEFHPYLQHQALQRFHKEQNIALAGYAPLTAVTKYRPGLLDKTYARLADKYKKTEGEIALRWVIDQGIVVITTSQKESRMKEYLGALNFKLTPDEVKEIAELGKKKHIRAFWTDKYIADDTS
jgi:diketogulonate reductase-like aldo/keto reductase